MEDQNTVIRSDLAQQYSHLWEHFRRLVRDFDDSTWTSVGPAYLRPARVSLHILGAAKYYLGAKGFRYFTSGKAFDLEWTIAEESLLPDQADLLAAIGVFEEQTKLWISETSFEEENVEFPWCGKSRLAVVTYLLRHSHYHVEELNLLLQLSKNGQATDHWDPAME